MLREQPIFLHIFKKHQHIYSFFVRKSPSFVQKIKKEDDVFVTSC